MFTIILAGLVLVLSSISIALYLQLSTAKKDATRKETTEPKKEPRKFIRPNANILVVDDEFSLLEAAEVLYECETVSTVTDAIELTRSGRFIPKVVFLDLVGVGPVVEFLDTLTKHETMVFISSFHSEIAEKIITLYADKLDIQRIDKINLMNEISKFAPRKSA